MPTTGSIFKFPRHAAAEKALTVEVCLLAVVRPAVTMPVPDAYPPPGPPPFSLHLKLKGAHLLTRQYELLPLRARQRLRPTWRFSTPSFTASIRKP